MKKFRRYFIAIVLAFSVGITSVVTAHAAVAGAIGIGLQALQLIQGWASTSQQKTEALQTFRNSWSSASVSSGSFLIKTTRDELESLCTGLNLQGTPCDIVYSSSVGGSGVPGYWIRCTGEPRDLASGSFIDSQTTYSQKHYCVASAYVYYVYCPASNSINTYEIMLHLNSWIESIKNSCSSMDAYLYHIDSMLTSSLPALFTTQTGQGTFSVAELQYKVWQSVDGLEGSLSSIDSRLSALNTRVTVISNRLFKTVDGTTYTISDLVYNAWQAIVTMSGSVSRSEQYLNTMNTNIEGIYAAMYEVSDDISNSNFPFVLVSSSVVDSGNNPLTRVTIPYESAVDVVAFLNENYQNRKIKVIPPDGDSYERWFVRAELTQGNLIRCYCAAYSDHGTVYSYYLCDSRQELYVSAQPSYIDLLTTTVNDTSLGITAIVASVDANLTNLNTTVTGLAEAVANINASFSLGGLHLDIGDSSSNPIFTKPAASDLYLSSYLTDIEGNNYTVISSPYQSSTDIIGYINSEMVGKPITLLPRQGTREGELTRYVDHAYLDDNDYIRVLAKTAAGAAYSYFLASPEMAIFQSVAQPLIDLSSISSYIADIDMEIHGTNNALGRLEVYTDGIEGLIRTTNSSLTDIKGYTDDIEDINSSILSHMDSSDLVDDQFVSTMVDDWGDHLVYTVLNSDNVLSLFNAAFGDLPSDLDWAGARQFFQVFYSGGA